MAFGTESAIIYNNLGNNTDWKLFYHLVSDVTRNGDNVKRMYKFDIQKKSKVCFGTLMIENMSDNNL
jgi:hypothetical protein